MNFLHNFNFRGPKTPFYRRSRHDQSQAAKSHRGGSLLSEVIRDYTGCTELNLLRNVRKMHQMCDSRPGISSTVLSLVAGLYSSSNLKSMGFSFGAEQYILAKWKAEKEKFGLNEYQRHVPASTVKISDDIKSKNQGPRDRQTSSKRYPGIRLGLSKFYELCPKNFKKSTKRTDVCNICVAGEKVKKQYEMLRRSQVADSTQIARLKESVDEYKVHKMLSSKQRLNFNSQIGHLQGPVESSRDYYEKPQISDLCFCVISKSGGSVQRRYYNYLSENLSHDSLFAINCLKSLLSRSEMQGYEDISLWSDSGPHFKNADYLYATCIELPWLFPRSRFTLNYFMENHGKSDVDGHFGLLTRWHKDIERNRRISSIDELVSAFREKAESSAVVSGRSSTGDVYMFDIYQKDFVRGVRVRAEVSNDGLMACPLSMPDPSSYTRVNFSVKTVLDNRTDKYAPSASRPQMSESDIMGPVCRNTQNIRAEFLRGLGVMAIDRAI
ncbi:hypothetical protein BB558_007387, partial [Smittium angustum]